jgi:hypothetical protein
MSAPSPLSLYKLLPKTNCRDCGEPSCMAFAHALLREEAGPEACPHLEKDTAGRLAAILSENTPKEGFRDTIDALRKTVGKLDLATVADDLGARYDSGRLYVTCLGKEFIVLDSGELESVCHVNVWVELMLLNYCATGGRGPLSGKWVSYGQLPSAAPTAPYFERRTEEPLRAIADSHTDMFKDLMAIFGGRPMDGFDADYSVVIHPLPKVPFLVLYTAPDEEGFGSSLRILLDSSATAFVPKEAITYIGRGIVEMFKKIASKHEHVTEDVLFM